MIVDKQDSRVEKGRGFLHLLDWNGKSRKKLLPKTPELSEQLKQKKSNKINMPIIQYTPVIEDYTTRSLNHKTRSSSLIDEDEYRKSPGVVGKLMGLDSLPNSNPSIIHSTRFLDPKSISKQPKFEHKHYNQSNRKQRLIEKFQTEILPPKSAKPISITNHKLLSPIKSPGFVKSPNNPARKPSSRKPTESNAARKLKGQSMNKSWDGCLERKPLYEDGKKSVSLAVQAKVNVKKREGLSLYDLKNSIKKPLTNSVLKQNNQKQNKLIHNDKSVTKSPVSEIKVNKILTNKSVIRRKSIPDDEKKKLVKSNGLDVVSFTFTSPISRSTEKKNVFLAGKNGLNLVLGGDSLSKFLDEKLTKLTTVSSASVSRESQIGITPISQVKRNQDRTSPDRNFDVGTELERGYVKEILSDIESMFEDFTLFRTSKIVNPRLFDKLEAKRLDFVKKKEVKLRRKLVFDCVSECVDSRCRVWAQGVAVVRRNNRLVEEVCKQISGWENMKDCMVIELVEKNMSRGQHDTWLDFEFEEFEIGVDIEKGILSCLIDEALDDMLVLSN
ncbi:uncharacterized protein [Rutidosis leptorrhynchoides]|uniref:uncharacterized protein n=1 Tax=Rutidosis leptorrhynchoides TaxID=125765 RepID=UPI003A9945D5